MIWDPILQFFLPFLLVFIIIYAILSKTKIASQREDVNIIIAFTIAFLITAAGLGSLVAEIITPLAILVVVIAVMFIIFAFFGAKPEQVLKQKWLVALIALVAVILVFVVISPYLAPTNETLQSMNATQGEEMVKKQLVGPQAAMWIFGNPQVLSAIIILVLAAVLAFFLLYQPKPPSSS